MDLINLINHQYNRNLGLLKAFDNHIITLTTRLISWNHEENCIHFTKGWISRFHHEISKCCLGLVNTRCIDKNNLFFICCVNPHNFVTGCLSLITHDSNFLPHNMVQKSWFSYIRSTKNGHKSWFKCHISSFYFLVKNQIPNFRYENNHTSNECVTRDNQDSSCSHILSIFS